MAATKWKQRCRWFGHKVASRPDFYGWQWVAKHCSRCLQYPVREM